MTAEQHYEAPGSSYGGAVLRDGLRLLYNTATGTLALGTAVAAGSETANPAEPPDKNVLALTGVIPMGPFDGVEACFAKSGTISAGTFLVSYFRPIIGSSGKIVGYNEYPLCDVGAVLTYGAGQIGTGFAGVCLMDGTAPATAAVPAGTEVWATNAAAKSETTAVSTSTVLNNMDLVKTAAGDAYACVLRITPASGASHLRIQQSTGGGGGKMFCFVARTRGGALNVSRA